jgi:hypothetical protein
MFRIQRINVIKAATVAAVMYMIVIAIFVIPFLLLVAFARVAAPAGIGDQNLGGALAVGLFAVLFYGVLGWIFTAIACAIYNAVAGWIGGIEVKVEAVAPPAPPPAWMAPQPPSSAPPGSPAV